MADASVSTEEGLARVGTVLQVITATQRRGAEVFGFDLGLALSARCHVVRTVALTASSDGAQLPVEALGGSRLGPTTIRSLRRAAAPADVVVAHGATTLPASFLATFATPVPFVYRSIGDPSYWSNTLLRRLRVGLYLRRAAAVVALWPAAATELARRFSLPPERIRVIPNGVSSEHFQPATDAARAASRERFGLDLGAPVVLYLGALTAEKGVDGAVRAVCALPGAHLLVVGGGPRRPALEMQARDLAPGRVHFAGSLDDPQSPLAAADVLVLPSRTEGLPGVAIEAGLAGLPVVASDVGGVSEVVRHGKTGFLVPPGDDAALVAGLRAALSEGGDMGRRGRERCLARFDMAVVADAWSGLIDELSC